MSKLRKKYQLYDSLTIVPVGPYTGQTEHVFEMISGSRLVFTLFVRSIDPSATINLDFKNGFSLDVPFETILNINTNQTGHIKKVLTDFHSFFDVELNVSGGSAELALGIHVHENALSTRIENAEIDVDLNHIQQPNGTHDSVRIGDGVEEVGVTPNREISISDTLNNGGLDQVLDVTAGTPAELKVAATRRASRKYVAFEALEQGFTFGFSESSQSFRIFRDQFFILPVGENTEVWFDVDEGTKQIAIGELS